MTSVCIAFADVLLVTYMLMGSAYLGDAQMISSSSSNNGVVDQAENNIAFDLPDLTVTVNTPSGGEFQIEAYKSVNNDRIMLGAAAGQTPPQGSSQLFWVSVGQPMFVKTPAPPPPRRRGVIKITSPTSPSASRLFHFTGDGFYSYVDMLTPAHRHLLAATANAKYPVVNVSDAQIVHLILSKFECSLILFDHNDNKYLLKGKVTDFRHFPLRIDFRAPSQSIERKLFIELLDDSGEDDQVDLHFSCQIASRGKLMKTNTLTISLQQLEQIEFADKLFGPVTLRSDNVAQTQTVYVTREQMTELAGEMYSTLNIVEDYQMQEAPFREAFVEGLLAQVSISNFALVPIASALETLSAYGFDFAPDLQADRVRRDLGSILNIERFDNKSRIVLNESSFASIEQSSRGSGAGKVKLFGLKASADWARDNSHRTANELTSLSDQLRELNMLSHNDFKWEIDGDRIIPKSLNVARLERSRLDRTLTFRRVRLQTFNAAFDREFGMYTLHPAPQPASPSSIDQIQTRLTKLDGDFNRHQSEQGQVVAAVRTVTEQLEQLKQHKISADNRMETVNTELKNFSGRLVGVEGQPRGVRHCRVCFHESEGSSQCQGVRSSCSGWSSSPSYTQPFRDDTDNRAGGCHYQWLIECQQW